MTEGLTQLRCSGCGAGPAPDEPLPFRCPNAGKDDDVDHLLRRELVLANAFRGPSWRETFLDAERNPFVRYRKLLHSFGVATARGMDEVDYVHLVRSLDDSIAEVAGTGFEETPFAHHDGLNAALGLSSGMVYVKDETRNVSGSHKARHLAGIAIWLEVARRTGLLTADGEGRRFAIASCGNAALAAAVVAKAVSRELDVFVPPDAHPRVTKQLEELGARLTVCAREPGVPGDPCVHLLHDDLEAGALPFGVQGNENGLTLEGGLTLGWEIASALLRDGATLDRVFIQVGGGALASSCAQALREAAALGVLERMPRVHAVQTQGGHPLRRAWERVVGHALCVDVPSAAESDESLALRLAARDMADARADAIRYAATHRSEFMWPWESVPRSAAHGILDDETYDWLAIVEAMLETGGYPVVASEQEILEANDLGRRATGIAADHTGTAGLAGLLHIVRQGVIGEVERVAVLFTGRER